MHIRRAVRSFFHTVKYVGYDLLKAVELLCEFLSRDLFIFLVDVVDEGLSFLHHLLPFPAQTGCLLRVALLACIDGFFHLAVFFQI